VCVKLFLIFDLIGSPLSQIILQIHGPVSSNTIGHTSLYFNITWENVLDYEFIYKEYTRINVIINLVGIFIFKSYVISEKRTTLYNIVKLLKYFIYTTCMYIFKKNTNLVLWFYHIIQWQTVTIHVLMLYWCNTNRYEYCTYFDILCFDIYLSVLFRNNLNIKLKKYLFPFSVTWFRSDSLCSSKWSLCNVSLGRISQNQR